MFNIRRIWRRMNAARLSCSFMVAQARRLRRKTGHLHILGTISCGLRLDRRNFHAPIESPETLKKFSPITYLANNSDKIAPRSLLRELDAIKSRQWMIRLIVSSEKQLKRMSRSRSPITRKGFMELTTRTTMIVRVKLFKARSLS